MMTRREALKTTALAAAVCATPILRTAVAQPASPSAGGPFTLEPLPYASDALEPHIDAQTMEIHHGKHHAAYVSNLNKALAEVPELSRRGLEGLLRGLDDVPEKIRTTVRNNGGGHYNHQLFWRMMKKGGGGEPKGELAKAIEKRFGSFNSFKDEFARAALGQFGSGWAWLVWDDKDLRIDATANQDSPLMPVAAPQAVGRAVPLLGIDVWEHAYYLKYQNRRADYISAWWNVVNWDFVTGRFTRRQGRR
jgi:superoxide dismutase, Fe-Mn family